MSQPCGVVAGSGIDLLPLLDEVIEEIPFERFGGFGTPVAGHARRFVLGRCARRDVVLQLGRFHLYEGLTLDQVQAPVRWMQSLGVGEIVFTNAVGGIAPRLAMGDLVGVTSLHAWHRGAWVLPARIDLQHTLPGCAATGNYWWMYGPCYETRAEIAALRALGGDVVGMSTLPDAAAALELGLKVRVVSCVTNLCGHGIVTHEEVLRTGQTASARMVELMRGVCKV